MNAPQLQDPADEGRLASPASRLSPTGCEYYRMIPLIPADRGSTTTTEVTIYRKHLLILDSSLESSANLTAVDDLDDDQVLAIENLLEERNARTVGGGQWVLSGLRIAEGSKKFGLMISFRRYGDDFVDTLETAEPGKLAIGIGKIVRRCQKRIQQSP
ncbi:hypothetical protein RUND412_004237 [Rhizina undulata]